MRIVRVRWGYFFVAAAVMLLLAAGFAGGALAADGDLDPTFSGDGKQTVDIVGEDTGYGVAVQGDGKVIVAGVSGGGASRDFAVARLNANGTPDNGFDGDGVLTTDIGSSSNDEARGVGLQSDGKIIVAGTSDDGVASQFAVVRYNANGAVDTNFGVGGKAVFQMGSELVANAYAVAVQADDKIVVVGSARVSLAGDANFAVARLTADGDLDNTFDGDGRRLEGFTINTDEAQAVAIGPGGKIAVAGNATFPEGTRIAVLLLNSNGTPDNAFGGDGKVDTELDGPSRAAGVIVQNDGKVVAAGQVQAALTGFDFAVLRYNTNGNTDGGFGAGGAALVDFDGSDEQGYAIDYDASSGKLIVAGQTFAGATNNDFALARLNSGGTLDTSFGGDGRVTTDFGSGDLDTAKAVALAPGNKVVAAGDTADPGDTTIRDFAVARYAYIDATATPTRSATVPPGSTATPSTTPCGLSFSDVRTTDFFYTPVLYLACRNVISGYADGTFRPFANATRGQIAKIVVGAENWPIDVSGGPHFSDVPSTHPFYQWIETAANRNIISGYNAAIQCAPNAVPCFKPFNDVTRGQLSKIVVNARGWTLVNPPVPTFVDVPTTNPFYREIETAVSMGIISGYDLPGGLREFRWANNATRGQISKIVYEAVTVLRK